MTEWQDGTCLDEHRHDVDRTKALDILTALILGVAPEIIPFITLWQINIHRRSCLPYIRIDGMALLLLILPGV